MLSNIHVHVNKSINSQSKPSAVKQFDARAFAEVRVQSSAKGLLAYKENDYGCCLKQLFSAPIKRISFAGGDNSGFGDIFLCGNDDFIVFDKSLKKQVALFTEFLKKQNREMPYHEISSNSKIFKLGSGPDSIIVKQQHSKAGVEDNVVKRISMDFDNEYNILASLPKSFSNRLKLVGCKQNNGRINSIAVEYFAGKKLDANYDNINTKTLKALHDDCLSLDLSAILHRDLSVYNILVDDNSNVKIVDYGAAKTFSQIHNLSNLGVVKYKAPNFIALSNLENFEENALFVYLKQLETQGNDGIKKANDLFLEHLQLKSDFYKKHSKIAFVQGGNNCNLPMQNDLILSNAYSLLKDNSISESIKNDIVETEKLRIKMRHAQKRVRLYNDNTVKNPLTGMYWNMLEGAYVKALMQKTNNCFSKYENDDLKKYFLLQNELAKFHYEEIFKSEYSRRLESLNQFMLGDVCDNLDLMIQEDSQLKCVNSNGEWCGPCVPIYKTEMIDVSKKSKEKSP